MPATTAPVLQLPAALDASQAGRLDTVIEEYTNTIQNLELSIQHITDAALDLVEVEEQQEVDELQGEVREVLDNIALLKDSEAHLKELKTNLSRGQKITHMIAKFEQSREQFQKKWAKKTDAQRYNTDSLYIEFQQKLWDVNHEENEPMPPLEIEEDADNSDDDLVMGTQRVSLNCPLTQQLLDDPYTSTSCRHSFSKSAIMDYIKKNHGSVACPVIGCDAFLRTNSLEENRRLSRQVEKRRQKQEAAALDDDDGDDEYTAVE